MKKLCSYKHINNSCHGYHVKLALVPRGLKEEIKIVVFFFSANL